MRPLSSSRGARIAALATLAALAAACAAPGVAAPGPLPAREQVDAVLPPAAVEPALVVASPTPGPLHVTGDPAALPGFLLIADRGNSRIIEVDGRGDITWEFPPPGYRGEIPFDQPDDAFYSPDGRFISSNQEFEHTVQVIDRATRRVTWSYGQPFVAGSRPGLMNGPDDAEILPDGRVAVADIKNCRVLVISPDRQTTQLGHTGVCRHDPAAGYLSSPNGSMADPSHQHLVVSEIGGNWVDVYHLPDLAFEHSFKSPAAYISDAIMQADGTLIFTDYSLPGAVYRTDSTGRVLWKFAVDLDHPSIAIGLPNGLVAIADDYGDRVLIVDPAGNQVRWQYGTKNRPGRGPGQLFTPDGLDFRLPDSAIPPGTLRTTSG